MPRTVDIPPERLNKILTAVSVLALGGVEPGRTQISVQDEDDLAVLEHTLNELGAELATLRIQYQQAQETIDVQRLAIGTLARPIVELIKLLGLQIEPGPAGGYRKDLAIIVEELLGALPK